MAPFTLGYTFWCSHSMCSTLAAASAVGGWLTAETENHAQHLPMYAGTSKHCTSVRLIKSSVFTCSNVNQALEWGSSRLKILIKGAMTEKKGRKKLG